ncbi:NAD(P)H-hydrate epimerase, partial [bacterium]|nr:NAD(P)H-hydrate epimerase [bacterium]
LAIPTLLLMENAGAGLSCAVCAWLASRGTMRGAPVAIVCGKGGNGGDGLVLARHLSVAGHSPRVALASPPATFDRSSDAGANLTIVERLKLPLEVASDGAALAKLLEKWADAVLVADALLGTGLSEQVREPHRGLIEAMNGAGRPIVAVDVPSGLDVDTGAPLGVAVRATFTVTFGAMKKGFERPEAAAHTGPVLVVSLGTPLLV